MNKSSTTASMSCKRKVWYCCHVVAAAQSKHTQEMQQGPSFVLLPPNPTTSIAIGCVCTSDQEASESLRLEFP